MQFRATVKVKAVAAPLLASILWMPLTTGFMLPGALLSPTKQCLMPPSSAIVSLSSSNTIDSSQNDIMKDAPLASSTITSSLASDYGVRINPSIISENGECGELEWELHPLGRWEEPNQGEGTLALRALGATRSELIVLYLFVIPFYCEQANLLPNMFLIINMQLNQAISPMQFAH